MQTKSIASASPAGRSLSLKANFLQLKKLLLSAAFLLSFTLFAAPAAGQSVTLTTLQTDGSFNQIFYTVTFTTAQTGLSASNFSVTGNVTGAYVSSVTGSGTTWGVEVTVPSSFQSAGDLSLEMVNSTGVSPGVTGLPAVSNLTEIILYSLTGRFSLTSTNANPGYAKTGDKINFTLAANNYVMTIWTVTIAGVNVPPGGGSYSASGSVTLGSGTGQGALSYSWSYHTQYNTIAFGSGTSSIIFDNIAPTASISAPSANIVGGTGTSSVSYTVTYADANFGSSNLTASGITLHTTGTATGTVGVSGSGTTYTVTISNISGNGTLGISVGAGYAVDLAGNTEASGAGPSSTVTVVPNVSPSISYAGPQGYAVNTAISPLTPSVTAGAEVFAGVSGAKGVALDYNGNAYAINTAFNILMYPSGGGPPVTAYNANGVITNVAVAPISSTTSTLIFGIGGAQLESMDVVGGVFQAPVTIGSVFNGFSPVAATHPASGPDVVAVFTDNNSNINFTARTGGVYSAPAPIANALVTVSAAVFAGGTALALNNYQGAVKLAFVGQDNNLYYSIYSGGIWSAVAPWATPNISMSGIGAFALDAQGNVWYSSGTSLYEITPASTGSVAMATLPAAANGIAFDISGNIYVDCGTEIEELQVPGGFQVTPSLPAGLSINSTTGIISGTPTTLAAAANYTVTATAGANNLTANVNIQIVTTPSLSYGSAVNATIGTAITSITPTSGSISPQSYNSTPATFASVTSPTGLATDGSGNVYVAENGGSVVEIPAGGGIPTSISSGNTFGPIAIDGPGNIYISVATNGNIANINGFTIIPINPTPLGTTITGSMESASGGVAGMGVDAAGNVYAAGLSPNIVYEYIDPLNSTPNLYGQSVAIPIGTGFTLLSGLAVDAAGNIYVTDAGAGTIDVIPTNRGQWTTLVSGLGAPANICIDGGGNLYFSDNNTNTIREIPAGSTTPVVIASGLGSITALAIDGTGKLYAADNTNSIIDEFSPVGGYYINPQLPPGFSFNGATGVISGTPTVASAAANYTITAYNPIGSVSATQSITATASLPTLSYGGPLTFTTGSANVITPASAGVSAQGYATVPVFMDYKFGQPWAVAVDTALNVYVADPWNFGTKSLAPPSPVNGPFYNPVFKQGNTAPLFYTPLTSHQLTGVAVDSTGNVYIAKNQVGFSKLVPSTENTYVETVFPAGLVNQSAIDSKGNIFATQNTNVVQFTSGNVTTVASGFSLPSGITVDGLGNIFVGDYAANTLYKIPAGSNTPAAVATGFSQPWQLAADGTGNVFIADGGNGVVKEYPAGGGTVTTVISGLQTPKGVAVDKNGVLYVADAGFQQVRKYTPSGGYYISPSLPAGLIFNNSTGVISGTPTAVTPVKNYKITAYNLSGSTQTTVSFGVVAPSSNLANLTLSAGSLSPVFATTTTGYSVSVPYNTSQITVTPTSTDGNATITVNGTAVSSGSSSGAIALSIGANTIAIVVTASDNSSTQTYTVTVNRAAVSSNAQLAGAGIGYISSGGVVEAVVTPITVDPNATVTVNGVAVASGSQSTPIPLSPGSNTIIITVTAQNGANKLTYKITVEGPLSGVSTLSSLTISAGTLSPAFSGSTTSYTDNVNTGIASVTVTPTTTDPNATIAVNNTAVVSGTPSSAIGINIGNNTISTVVTAQDGVTATTYTITVIRPAPSSNASLSNLILTNATFTPVFATGTTTYTASVDNTIIAVTATPITSDATATVTVNGLTVSSGTASQSIPLAVGANAISTKVTAQDGTTSKTYTVTIIRAPSSNSMLSGLTLSSGTLTPAFANTTTSYTASVTGGVSSITVTPKTGVPTSTVTVNGVSVTSGTASQTIMLNVGLNTITTVVTAQNGTNKKTYTVKVTRAVPDQIATLSNLAISAGTLSPAFATATTGYTAAVDNTVIATTATPAVTDATATVTVNGLAVSSGTASQSIPLAVGPNTITVVVTAQDGSTTKTYTVTITRAPSSNATLSSLALSSGTLAPSFISTTTSYTASVANTVATITVTPKTGVPTSTVTVNGTTVTSGTASGAIALKVGANTITTVVTAQNGTNTKTYKVTVTRAPGGADSYIPIAIGTGISVTIPIAIGTTETPTLAEDGIQVHQGVSPNGDGINDFLIIENIINYPDNKLMIMNRSGQLVFEAKGYDNSSKIFDGHSNKNGQMQLPGTYFYQLDYTAGGIIRHKTGFIVLKY
jgi:gliding motility-associated-like protein